MPYGSKKRRPYRKYSKKKPTVKKLARRVARIENSVETKFRDIAVSADPTGTATTFLVNALAQGDDFNQRIGEQVIAKKLDIMLRLTKAASDAVTVSYRIIVFRDKANNAGTGYLAFTGASPTNAELATALVDNTTIANQLIAPLNYRTSERYNVYLDKTFNLNAYSSSMLPVKQVKYSINLHNAIIKYGSSDATTTGVASTCYNVMFVSNTTTQLNQYLGTRFWFTDA